MAIQVQVGPHSFDRVVYDDDRDVLDLGWGGAAEDDTPEGHNWLYSLDAPNEIAGLIVNDAHAVAQRDGEIYVTLPEGDRVVARGAAALVRPGRPVRITPRTRHAA